jgi:hypothetical protein
MARRTRYHRAGWTVTLPSFAYTTLLAAFYRTTALAQR